MLTMRLLEDTIKKIENNNKLDESDKKLLLSTYKKELKIIEKIHKFNICGTLEEVEKRINNCEIYLMSTNEYKMLVENDSKYSQIKQIVNGA